MLIFDRWGDEIFTSGHTNAVWDGRVNGTDVMAPQGVYVYKIIIFDAQMKEHEFMGHVNLIR
jgi:gliding motility-associated-like protein